MAQSRWYECYPYERDWIPHATTYRYTHQLVDDAGAPLLLTQITTVQLTIYNLDVTPAVPITGTWPRDVKNVAPNAVSSTGFLTLIFSATDNTMLVSTRTQERRAWVIEYTHTSGTRTQRLQVDRVLVRTLPLAAS